MGSFSCKERKRLTSKSAPSCGKTRKEYSLTRNDDIESMGSVKNTSGTKAKYYDKSYADVRSKYSTKDSNSYETIRSVEDKPAAKKISVVDISDDKSYAKVLDVTSKFSAESNTNKSIGGLQLYETQTTISSTQSMSSDQDTITLHEPCGMEQCTICDQLHDMCSLCASRGVGALATHICLSCSKFGRYFCYKCLQYHNKFSCGHDVRSLSANIFHNSNRERLWKDQLQPTDERYSEMPTTTERKGIRPKLESNHAERDQMNKFTEKNEVSKLTSRPVSSRKALSEPIFRTQETVNRSNQTLKLPNEASNMHSKAADWINEAPTWTNKDMTDEFTKIKAPWRQNKSPLGPHDANSRLNEVRNKQNIRSESNEAQSRLQNVPEITQEKPNESPQIKKVSNEMVNQTNETTNQLREPPKVVYKSARYTDEPVKGQSKMQCQKYEANEPTAETLNRQNIASFLQDQLQNERTSDHQIYKIGTINEVQNRQNFTSTSDNRMTTQNVTEELIQKQKPPRKQHETMNWKKTISQQYSELYNKEWANGFNVLVHPDKTNKTEKQACEILLRVLITIYLVSVEKVQENLKNKCSELVSVTEECVPEKSVLTSEAREKKHANLKKRIIEELMKRFEHNLSRQERTLIREFISKCAGLCLLIATREPKVCIDTETACHWKSFDSSKHKPYKAIGTRIDYVVWPALCLEDSGTILKKGIVQVIKQTEEKEDSL